LAAELEQTKRQPLFKDSLQLPIGKDSNTFCRAAFWSGFAFLSFVPLMTRSVFLLIFSLLLLYACGNTATETTANRDTGSVKNVSVTKRVSDIEPGLQAADSLQVLYYDNPDGDSLRYTRFFTYTETNDSAQIKTLINELDQVYVQEPKTRPCRSEGKLYLLRGEDILKTVYFSTRGDSCRYFYFIRDGVFIYFPVTEKAVKFLTGTRQNARKP
jgi:hypothetical protein